MKKEISLAPSLVFVLQRRWEQCNGRDGDSDDNRDDNEDSVNDDDNDDSSVYVHFIILFDGLIYWYICVGFSWLLQKVGFWLAGCLAVEFMEGQVHCWTVFVLPLFATFNWTNPTLFWDLFTARGDGVSILQVHDLNNKVFIEKESWE